MRWFVVLLLLSSCTTKEVSREELQKYIADEDNGLSKISVKGGIEVRATLVPTDYLLMSEVGSGTDTATIGTLSRKYAKDIYIVLSLSKDGKEALHQTGDYGAYSELLQVLSFRMAEFVKLTSSEQDTIYLEDYSLNRSYGMASSTDILLAFSRAKIGDDEWVQFHLKEFGLNTGAQQFKFTISDLTDCPRVRYP